MNLCAHRSRNLNVGRQSVREIGFGFRRLKRGSSKGAVSVSDRFYQCLPATMG